MNEAESKLDHAAREFAGHALIALAGGINGALGPYSGWLVGGIAGAISLLTINLENVLRFVQFTQVRWCLASLVLALFASTLAKLWSTRVAALMASLKAIAIDSRTTPAFDQALFLEHFRKGFNPISRFMLDRALARVPEPGTLGTGIAAAKLSQQQALLNFAALGLCTLAGAVLFFGFQDEQPKPSTATDAGSPLSAQASTPAPQASKPQGTAPSYPASQVKR
jgi:hypothetical protein